MPSGVVGEWPEEVQKMRPICSVTITRLVGVVACLLLGGLSASAHHSVSGVFDVTKEVTVTGTISKLEWINPHIFIFLQEDVKDPTGTAVQWSFETLPPAMLRKAGLTKEALAGKFGEVVTVKAVPAKADPHAGLITRITYPDGHFYQLYESPQ
jgi:hypothetical protein